MIDINAVKDIVNAKLDGSKYFLVDVQVSKTNEINVEIDADEGVDIDFCVELSRYIELQLDREVEDYELNVGSAGLTTPFKIKRQYEKNIGNQIEVLAADGKKHRGTLVSVDSDSFKVDERVMEKREGDKRKKEYLVSNDYRYDEVKKVTCLIDF